MRQQDLLPNSVRQPSLLLVIIAFATVYIVWGSTYYFIQVAVYSLPPMMIGAMRFLSAGSILLVWSLARGERIGRWKEISTSVTTGLMMLLGGTGAVIWAEKWIPSSLAAILIASAPFWFILLDYPKWRSNLTNKKIILGLVIGFVGVNMMFSDKVAAALQMQGNKYEMIGLVLLLFATISWAAGSLVSKYRPSGSANMTSAIQMVAAGIVFLFMSLLLKEWKDISWSGVPLVAWLSVLYLIVFGSLAAYSAYIWLLRVRPAAQVSTYAYVNPLIAVLLGVMLGGEQLTWIQAGGLAVILAGVLLINLGKFRRG
jgi:drug/metabolite transporter (DMT)-like permease